MACMEAKSGTAPLSAFPAANFRHAPGLFTSFLLESCCEGSCSAAAGHWAPLCLFPAHRAVLCALRARQPLLFLKQIVAAFEKFWGKLMKNCILLISHYGYVRPVCKFFCSLAPVRSQKKRKKANCKRVSGEDLTLW